VWGYKIGTRLTRFGPERPFESYQNLRLVRREKMGWALEIEDVNGIDICPPLSQYSSRANSLRYSRHTIIEKNPPIFDFDSNFGRPGF